MIKSFWLIMGELHLRHARVSAPTSITERTRRHDHAPGTEKKSKMIDVDVHLGGKIIHSGRFAQVRWSWGSPSMDYLDIQSLTSHPNLTDWLFLHGPSTVNQLPRASWEIVTLDQQGKYEPRSLRRIAYDSQSGLYTVRKKEQFDALTLHGEVETRRRGFGKDSDTHNIPQFLYDYTHLGFMGRPLHNDIPAVQHAFAELGAAQTADAHIFPDPEEYARRMDRLRTADTSGVFYPNILLVPMRSFDAKTLVSAYAAGQHPVSTEDFSYFIHDGLSNHMLAFMAYGEPLMDLVSTYAKVAHDTGSQEVMARATGEIDPFTASMGMVGLDFVHEDTRERSILVETLRKQKLLDGLQVVQWMRKQDMVHDIDKLTFADLKNGLRLNAKERFALAA